jgi:hypothetical protein
MPSHVSSPDALGVVRNLPADLAGAALHPVIAPTGAVLDLQDDLEHSGIGLGGELALPGVAAGLRIERDDRIGEFWGNPASRAFAELLRG